MPVLRYYRWPGCTPGTHEGVSKKIKEEIGSSFESLSTELCYYIETEKGLPTEEEKKLEWILMTPFQETGICTHSVLTSTTDHSKALIIEIGPRLNFSTPLSTNAVSICKSIGLESVSRIEASLRYQINFTESKPSDDIEERLVHRLHDRMTQCRYIEPVKSFKLEKQSDSLFDVDIMGEGKNALERANKELGLAFDDWDLDFYTSLFQEKIRRNPTSVECFDLAQSNSEHCRHWFFRGRLIVDGEEYPESLFKMIMGTQQHTNDNNIIKFSDNKHQHATAAIQQSKSFQNCRISMAISSQEAVEASMMNTYFTDKRDTAGSLVPQLKMLNGDK